MWRIQTHGGFSDARTQSLYAPGALKRGAGAARARFGRLALAGLLAATLAACASRPGDISRIPAQVGQETGKQGVFTQPVKWERTRPGCKGECPSIKVDSIVFPGNGELTELVDQGLAYMTGVDATVTHPYATIAEFEDYFWKTAGPRDSVVLAAKTVYRNRTLTSIELDTWQYLTGMAHGLSATRYLNWDNSAGKLLALGDVLRPGARDAYLAALRAAHQRWLDTNPDARHDRAAYERMWPFQPSDNFAFTDSGLVVRYNAYEIAPYSAGQPELAIPYSELADVLRPAFLPAQG
ncbi:DUF3298 domain-containing protein [Pusillimonas sp. TS35]|uniref:RsiV family protein n=1 Tax=Paracandidimonas lactea TaxID=2895524 RepID=UPI00136DD45E|nr:RsiV family protein [Paracandidimonas lactea]MYN12168.1 DUF3298 domain-containing protein [Pusillimonas sp. TS35]